jgi:hypothetical protein
MTRRGEHSVGCHELATRNTTDYLLATPVTSHETGSSTLGDGTADAPSSGMSPRIEELVKSHRVEHAKREAAWADELEGRRREIAKRACLDVEALRAKLAI